MLLFPTPSWAGLVFESTEFAATATPEQDKIPVTFRFKNTSEEAVTVKEVQTTCGCLTAATDKMSYEPGESGEVKAEFSVGSAEGEDIKSLYVLTSDEKNPRQELKTMITVPALFRIEPLMQKWTVNEAAKPKKIDFKVVHKDPIEIVGLTSSRDNFTAEFKEIEKGRHYEITLIPKTTEAPMLGALSVMTNCSIERHRTKLAFFSITRN